MSEFIPSSIPEFLEQIPVFKALPAAALNRLAEQSQFLRYRPGQVLLARESLPAQVCVVQEGQVRLLGYDPRTQTPTTLKLLEFGDVLGWESLVRGLPSESALASTEVVCLTIPSLVFLDLLEQNLEFGQHFRNQVGLVEVFDLLGRELERQADSSTNLKQLALQLLPQAQVAQLSANSAAPLSTEYRWMVSGTGGNDGSNELGVGQDVVDIDQLNLRNVRASQPLRVVGLPRSGLAESLHPAGNAAPNVQTVIQPAPTTSAPAITTIPYASEQPQDFQLPSRNGSNYAHFPVVRGRGPVDGTVACFQMLCQYLNLPFKRDVVRRVLRQQNERLGSVPLSLCGSVAEMLGLTTQLVRIAATDIGKVPVPALIRWQDSCAVIYQTSEKEVVLGLPESGILKFTPDRFVETWGASGEVLLLQATKETPQQRFGLSWFWPSVVRYRRVLIEVLIASFFVQLFGLANPLITQVIIDKVLNENGEKTLPVLGALLLGLSVFEALLTSLRTYLFVDTTNRIDMALGSQVIDHLLRLPLRYYDKRPVGELSTRINELENIRSFLTGTALTVVLDAIFSVIYIGVMIAYSWMLTIVALATVPVFALLTFSVAPIIRRQARDKAEKNAQTQSYLVEAISGIQTIKAQNIELNARWRWQERYASYVSAGFKTVFTSTTAGSLSTFLNQFSGLLLLVVGASLVLEHNRTGGQSGITLGQLIAFRIIAGYTTSPLLRLIQLWQNFQETALSLERLADILDSPQEVEISGRNNIPMPAIQGQVSYENLSFRFQPNGPLQLANINLTFPQGNFVALVGQSGSGKSTLMKLLSRLYESETGRILIDNYDINKVELYSLRSQIGVVLQDTLLFQGTVLENIALGNPDAAQEEVIEAAKIAYAHDFIMTLPAGYNTQVGERGANLSGGQRQRIAIARTVLQNPNLLVLDEATSALDYLAERQVYTNLRQAFRGRTVFFITHRLASIADVDRIVMMDQGRVAEQGTHDELMALRGQYYVLFQQQAAQV
jgi:ATP-binding cassette, subfamily B, bacterial HlyB/CyaB